MQWILVGNPQNRRVRDFVSTLSQMGRAVLAIVPWRELVADPQVLHSLPNEPAFLRLESPGEDPEVQAALMARGGGPHRMPRHGELLAPTATHRGFLSALADVQRALDAHPRWVPLATPASIAEVFDKQAFHHRCRALNVSAPEALPAATVDDLLEALAANPRTVFVKLRYGSSASGLGIYRPHPRPRLMTTVRVTPNGWFNSRRVNRVTEPTRIRTILEGLIERESAHIEFAVPKASLQQAFFDCRVLMVHHEPRFVVVRQSRHPITNLHLGGWRGNLDQLREHCPEGLWERAMDDCRRISTHYGGLHLGLDVAFERGWSAHRILEANAFGDLLPGLLHEGRSVYGTEIAIAAEWVKGWFDSVD